jgi:hypothetical protein
MKSMLYVLAAYLLFPGVLMTPCGSTSITIKSLLTSHKDVAGGSLIQNMVTTI